MTQVKTNDLADRALDWSVAKCEGGWVLDIASFTPRHNLGRMCFSTDGAQAHPIIERENISVLSPIVRRIGTERHAFSVDYWRPADLDVCSIQNR